ncbi:hypothetical protein V6N11_004719 [Hibiscus sabdariffa]|uniref:RING-type E3 ubiquitin transferase n=1 Tax=Hibiscus sabdariffa TaxID=183260 RepID=A0ABR2SHS6_9ROSI
MSSLKALNIVVLLLFCLILVCVGVSSFITFVIYIQIAAYKARIRNRLQIPNTVNVSSEVEDDGLVLNVQALERLSPSVTINEDDKNELNSSECPICLEEYSVGESCRRFPVCRHAFHSSCIDHWLHNHVTCPDMFKGVDVVVDNDSSKFESCSGSGVDMESVVSPRVCEVNVVLQSEGSVPVVEGDLVVPSSVAKEVDAVNVVGSSPNDASLAVVGSVGIGSSYGQMVGSNRFDALCFVAEGQEAPVVSPRKQRVAASGVADLMEQLKPKGKAGQNKKKKGKGVQKGLNVAVRQRVNSILVLQDSQGFNLDTFESISGELVRFFSGSLGVVDDNVEHVSDDLLKELLGVELTVEMQNSLIAPGLKV